MSEGNGYAKRENIFGPNAAAPKLNQMLLQVPAWGGLVTIREMTSEQQDCLDRETRKRLKSKSGKSPRIRERLLIATVHVGEENPQPLFTPEDEDALAKMPSSVLDRPFKIAAKLCGYTDDDEDDEGN